MLTKTGKSILAKYLVNQAPGYAGYIAIGCGANPLSTMTFDVSLANINTTTDIATITTSSAHNFLANDTVFIKGIDGSYDGAYTVASVVNSTAFTVNNSVASANVDPITNGTVTRNYAEKENLDFEMFRVPIISRALAVESNLTKVVFTAQLPTLEQYGMTEIGIYPSGTNPVAGVADSRILFNFSDTERWEFHSDTTEQATSKITGLGNSSTGAISAASTDHMLLANSSDPIFNVYDRLIKKEQPRFELKTIMVRGNTSGLNTSASTWTLVTNEEKPDNQAHIHHTNVNFTFDQNTSEDQLKLAFSVIPSTASSSTAGFPNVKIMVQFSSSETLSDSEYANMQIDLPGSTFDNSRYYVATKTLSELKKTANFQWSGVNTIKVFTSVESLAGTNISSSVLTSNVATIETGSAHGLSAGNTVKIVSRTGYDGVYTVNAVPNTTAFTFDFTTANIGSNTTDGGSVYKLHGDYWIALDALRFENIASINANPLYGLTGYSLLSKTATAANGASVTNSPVIKKTNSNNLVEFKFAIDTGGES